MMSEGVRVEIGNAARGEQVPGILMLPTPAVSPAASPAPEAWPAALLLHGLTSDKERMAYSIGRALRVMGVASLSIDLPLHGERRERDAGVRDANPLALAGAWRRAQREAHMAIDYLASRPDIDGRRLGLVGYSMGSFLGLLVAAAADSVRAVVLAAGGDLPTGTSYDRAMRLIADPLRAVQRLAGRPLLMVHGRHDRTVTPAQAQRLFDAAQEPKSLKWWDAGHYLPDAAINDAARWMKSRL